MRVRILGAALAAVLASALATSAQADILDYTDGKDSVRIPSVESPLGVVPTDSELRESKDDLDLTYESFKLGAKRGDAAQVIDFYLTDTIENEQFNNGEKYGVSGYWAEAATAFGLAAADLSGLSKQTALYKRMLAIANTGDNDATLRAAEEVLGSDPKTYYFGPAQEMRARISARRGKLPDAIAALKLVTDAQGMNVRDLFSAKYLSTWLAKSVGADNAQKWAEAEKAYRDLLREIESHPTKQLASVPRFRTMMSLGEALRAQGKGEEAQKLFDRILAEAGPATDKGVLAGVYYGLGDLVFEAASKLQGVGGSTPEQRKQVVDMLNQAALHYLRVTLLYKDFAGQRELFGATRGVARVFATLFTIQGEKDCDLARRAYDYYREAVQMQDRGEARRLLVREGKALRDRIEEVCGTGGGEKTAEGEGDDEEEPK